MIFKRSRVRLLHVQFPNPSGWALEWFLFSAGEERLLSPWLELVLLRIVHLEFSIPIAETTVARRARCVFFNSARRKVSRLAGADSE